MKLVQTGNKLCFCFVICGISFLLALNVWASPTVKPGGFVAGNRSVKSHDESARDTVPNFQNLGVQLRNLSGLWTEHKITGGSGLNAADQHDQITPESLPLHGRITAEAKPLTNQKNNTQNRERRIWTPQGVSV